MSEGTVINTVTRLVTPIVSDLKLDLYDVEMRSGTLRVTIDTSPGLTREDGRPAGVDLDTLALATRLISKELDAQDPISGHYTLEVTSPGLERSLRTPAHFQRELGKVAAIRLSNVVNGERRITGTLVAADERTVTVRLTEAAGGDRATIGSERTVHIDQIDRARTVFVWEKNEKPGKGPSKRAAKQAEKAEQLVGDSTDVLTEPTDELMTGSA